MKLCISMLVEQVSKTLIPLHIWSVLRTKALIIFASRWVNITFAVLISQGKQAVILKVTGKRNAVLRGYVWYSCTRNYFMKITICLFLRIKTQNHETIWAAQGCVYGYRRVTRSKNVVSQLSASHCFVWSSFKSGRNN